MRKLMMILTVLLLLATVSLDAQGNRGGKPGPRADNRLAFEALDLTPEQKAQLKEIRQATREKMQALRASANGERPDRAAMGKLLQESKQASLAILTPAQKAKAEALREERRSAWESVDKDALKAELKTHRTEVKAVLQAARSQLDDFISEEDQAAIDRLRDVMKSKPKGSKMKGGKLKAAKATPEQREQTREQFQQWRTDHQEELDELQTLSQKYAADIQRIRERLQPQVIEWKQEKREILEDYFPAKPGRNADKKALRKEKRRATKKDKPAGARQARRGAAFLLMKG